MKSRALPTWTVSGMLLVSLVISGCKTEPPPRTEPARRSATTVVLVTIDGLSASKLDLYGGSVPTPALAGLASQGTAWKDAWTACPMTVPAAATYLTGLAPDRHGVRDDLFFPLPDGLPTLATAAAAAGFRTAAFPGNGFLGASSGLLRGFETIDDPPMVPFGPHRRVPVVKPAADLVANFKLWLQDLPADARIFAWLHFADPWQPKLDAKPEDWDRGLEAADKGLGDVVVALRERNRLDDAVIAVAGTFGDPTGGGDDAAWPGLSLAARIVEVPLVLRTGASSIFPAEGGRVWSPDLPSTIARLAGWALPGAEGLDLAGARPADRIVQAWSWATRDQMGWQPLRAAATAGAWLIEGLPRDAVSRSGDVSRLEAALGARPMPPLDGVPREDWEPLLALRGVKPDPLPLDGRAFGPMSTRREVSQAIASARLTVHAGNLRGGGLEYIRARGIDPENLAAMVDRAMIFIGKPIDKILEFLAPGLARYPWDPELLHWYGHVIDTGARDQSERFWKASADVRPHVGDLLYDLACMRSLAGDLDASADYLRRSIRAGYRRFEHMQGDPDLRNLRESDKFAEVMREFGR